MTNVIYDIFVKRNNATQALIVKQAPQILAQCCQFANIINDAHNVAQFETKNSEAKAGTDAIREAIMNDGHFAWLYDTKGKPNKKGISKLIMSDAMRKIREGMLFLADENNSDLFMAWAESKPNKSGVCDFANIKKAITPKTEKTKSASNVTESEASATDESATDAKRTPAEFLAWVYKQAMVEFNMDPVEFAQFAESPEGMKIADEFIKAA